MIQINILKILRNIRCGTRENQRSKVNSKVKYDFSENNGRDKCNFNWRIHFLYYFMIQGHPQGQIEGYVNENMISSK